MTDQPPKLPRKPFGYDPSVVDQMLADRDSMLALAERRVREAEGKAARLEEQVAARDAAIVDLNEKATAAPAESEPQPAPQQEAPPEQEPLSPRFMTEELAKIILAAEESTSQILARARHSTRDQILEADRLWREVQTEVVRFASWRVQAESALSTVQSAIDQARTQIEAVPDRVQNALAPAVEAMVRVDSQMAGFSAAATLPLLAAPSGLEEARARMEASESADEAYEPSETPSVEAPPPDPMAGPSDSDWPSLGEPPSLNEGDAVDGEDDGLMEQASHELRHFQSSRETAETGAEEGSAVWGA